MSKNLIIVVMAAALAVSIAIAVAQGERTANIEVRVWERVDDPRANYISARVAGGSWRTLGTTRLAMHGETERGTYRYADLRMDVPVSIVATPTPEPVTDAVWPVTSFEVAIGTDVWDYMTVAVAVPARLDGIMYVYVQGDPLRGQFNCHNNFTLYPEDGLTGLSCSLLDTELDEITLVRANVFDGNDTEGYEYRCARDELFVDYTWVCWFVD